MKALGAYIERKADRIKSTLAPSTVTASTASTAVPFLTNALRTLHNGAQVFPPLQAAIEGLLACIECIELEALQQT
ncbi:hypothetical protein RhiXN_08705 [Rhizoctonia solani]|uniref:Uncharacterized protein n=1 Tax=Rhizoctonia solani TaxID=456999 RepID=A0A8H8SZJ6_9AGAM|nr:uncharacterized protein RhiXN_08705 [Rhizoctonia solani]QRW23669.1 hypothetical protein RhiXN_08705 [Rhizoctonia solani]